MQLTPSACSVLRSETSDLHRMLDSQSIMTRLLDEHLTPQIYAAVLRRLLVCHERIEALLDAFRLVTQPCPAWLSPMVYKRATALRADLVGLGEPPVPQKPRKISAPIGLVNSRARAAGIIYVIAGSSLGARVISRSVEPRLGALSATCMNYLGGQRTSLPDWTEMRRQLDEELVTSQQMREATDAARDAFQCFIDHLSPQLMPWEISQPALRSGKPVIGAFQAAF
jgi:heme oxygenase